MRAAFFLPDLNGGGAERAALLLQKYWPESSPRPPVIVRAKGGAFWPECSHLDSPIVLGLPQQGFVATLGTPVRLARVCRESGIDVVVAFLSLPSVVAAKALNPRIKVVWSAQNPPGLTIRGEGLQTKFLAVATQLLLPGMMRHLDAIVLPVGGLANVVTALGWHRSYSIVANPVSPSMFEPSRSRGTGLPHLVSVGRLVPQKRFDVLLDALALLKTDLEFRASIWGDGPLREQLATQASRLGLESIVDFPGFAADIKAAYDEADAFVLSSDYEGFGNVVVEAMACGLPVIATDAPFGPRDILDDGRYGLLVPRNSPVALAEAIRTVLSDSSEAARLGAVANERARSFMAPTVAEAMCAALTDCMSAR